MSWFERHIARRPEPLPPDATRDGLLAAVVSAPHDDAPRWVYSDFLLERGDPRGELIAVQLTLVGIGEDDPRREALVVRQDELLAKHKKKWTGDFKGTRIEYGVEDGPQWVRASSPMRWSFARGFVDTVRMAAADFIRNADELLRREPVRRVHLTNAVGQMQKLVNDGGEVERIRELDLGRCRLHDDDLHALLSTPRLSSLEALSFSQCRIGVKRSVTTLPLLDPAKLPKLTRLSLHENGLGDRGVAALLKSPIIGQLRDLGLGHNNLKAVGAESILAADALDGIERLNLMRHNIPVAEQRALRARFGDRVLL